MNQKLIFLDIDGTLCQPGSNVPPASALEAIEKYGAVKGGFLAVRRILRCSPLHRQESIEYDPVP